MALGFPADWRFSAGAVPPVPQEVLNAFYENCVQVAKGAGDNRQKWVIETFKESFSSVKGKQQSSSSSFDWALSDLQDLMQSVTENAALFIDAFWSSLETLHHHGVSVPSVEHVNTVLARHGLPFAVSPPHLVERTTDAFISDLPVSSKSEPGKPAYMVIEVIDQGGFGVVKRVKRVTAVGEFMYAMKVYAPSPFNERPEKGLKRFQREIAAVQRLQHRGIIEYIDAGLDHQGNTYLVMPLVHGNNIRDAAASRTAPQNANLLAEVLFALDYAHSQDVLHRDLKPSNILVRSSDGQPVIIDWGTAYLRDALVGESLTTSLVGSQGYIPTEVHADHKLRTPKQDVFACGVILYEMFARRRPDPADYQPLADFQPWLAPLDSVIQTATAPASRRYPTIAAFRGGLHSAIPLLPAR